MNSSEAIMEDHVRTILDLKQRLAVAEKRAEMLNQVVLSAAEACNAMELDRDVQRAEVQRLQHHERVALEQRQRAVQAEDERDAARAALAEAKNNYRNAKRTP